MTRRLAALRVGNFKAFADTQRIPLKPITLIFGPNSAGKSSFIHSLALAHEAQFGGEKRSLARLDVHHTEVGGSAIDLGGFRQFVHRGQLNKRVEWGAELEVSTLDAQHHRLAQLLAPIKRVALNISLGIELDNEDRPKAGAEPRVESVELSGDGAELLRMSRRRSDTQGSTLRVDRLASDLPVFRNVLKAIVESTTTSEEMRPEDYDGANEVISELLPQLLVRVEYFFPTAVDIPISDGADTAPVSMLFPVSKGNRKEDIAQAVRFYLPRTLNDLIKGLSDVLADELQRLQYLGPLRSFPPRHLAFAENEDKNWYAGGGYAWEVVRRNSTVREAVNSWLGSEKLKTPYQLVVRRFVPLESIRAPLERVLEEEDADALNLENTEIDGVWARDVEAESERILKVIEMEAGDELQDLSLIDKRTGTRVSHRDVGIGISQVLPVLVACYGSENKLLAMEQPEIHLHPALQADLGDVFVESALGARKNTFILETHSEHLILRLLRRIRETHDGALADGQIGVRPEDVQVLCVVPGPSGSRFVDLPITTDGDFSTPWPDGFFPERAKELF